MSDILIDGVLYVKVFLSPSSLPFCSILKAFESIICLGTLQIVDLKLASYGVENPIYAVIQLAQTTMRSELGKITLDKTFEERDTLNEKIVVRFLSLILPYFFPLLHE